MNLDTVTAQALLDKAEEAASKAYAPYSLFPVGAALLLEDGRVLTGCNVENASHSLTVCAERVAIFKALSESFVDFRGIAIWAHRPNFHSVTPCGACRQVMAEFFKPQTPVIFYHPKTGEVLQMPLETLMPYAFFL